MIDLATLRVSLTKNGFFKVAELVKMYAGAEVLDHVRGDHVGINIARSQIANMMDADIRTGLAPAYWDDIRDQGEHAIDAFTVVVMLFSHGAIIDLMQRASEGRAEYTGYFLRGDLKADKAGKGSEKAHTNFAYALACFGLSRYRRGAHAVEYNLQPVVYERWYDQKYGITRNRSVWVKAHVASGVKTNVVTAVRILEQHSGDSPQFVPLVKETRKNFEIEEVSADKAYVSVENFETVAECGGQAFIAFKSNNNGLAGGMLEKAFHFFQFNQEEYTRRYHKRSNVESTFSAVKRKFGDSVMSRTDTGMVNEVLCKFLCHNLTCLIQEQETLGIAPVFWKNDDEGERNVLPLPATHSA